MNITHGKKRSALVLFVLAIVFMFYLAMREKPVMVDIATVARGPMVQTITEQGVTRIRDIYTISSTVAGHLDRIDLEEGDSVIADTTTVAMITPLDSPFLDTRTQTELLALADASKAAVDLAVVESKQAATGVQLAQSAYRRARKLGDSDLISQSELENVYGDLQVKLAQLERTKTNIQVREAELARVQAQLIQPSNESGLDFIEDCCISLYSPIDGTVLKVFTTSEQVVTAGTPLLEVGNTHDLDITLDMLSRDAVSIKAGTSANVTDWGGEQILQASVVRVKPAAFTKVSALGIEEQRVTVELNLKSVPKGLGHGYRVLATLIVWEAEDVVMVPIGALFRENGQWSVFVEQEGRATTRKLVIDHMNDQFAEVIEGVSGGERIVLYPSDKVINSALIEQRVNSGN